MWHSYLYWARERVLADAPGPGSVPAAPAIVDDAANRISEPVGRALQAVLFSAFALEYRLKRVLLANNIDVPPTETLRPCLDQFWNRLAKVHRRDGHGLCLPPVEWAAIKPQLDQLVTLRNTLAHANYTKIVRFLESGQDAEQQAKSLYRAVVEAIKLINLGTGYETRPVDEVNEYFRALLV